MNKNIIVCYDGTADEFGRHNTNVVHLFQQILRNDEQVAFYDPGVGTFESLGRVFGKKLGILFGKAFGYGLVQNLEDGYEYLMNHYEPGDHLYILGFSRGAFTARKLADMIHYFGILQKGSINLIPYVSKYYLNRDFSTASDFKKTFCHDCKPYFIGVWDTVASLGLFFPPKFNNAKLSRDVRFAYQAVAIDEKRKKFPLSLWDQSEQTNEQYIEQVWFAGVHCDIGGWYLERQLSDIALAWMIDKATEHGLLVREDWKTILHQDPIGILHKSRTGFYRLWKPVRRVIPEGANIHQSVFDRKNRIKNYNPVLPSTYKKVSNPSYSYKHAINIE